MRGTVMRVLALATIGVTGFMTTTGASAAPEVSTGGCTKSFNVSQPTQVSCSFTMQAGSNHYRADRQLTAKNSAGGLTATDDASKARLICAVGRGAGNYTSVCPIEQWGS